MGRMKSKSFKIVIAEDDSPSREMLCELLRSWGYDVTESRNGAEALQKIAEGMPDLVVCDIQMPLLDGVGLVQALRRDKNFSNLPVIALTAGGARDPRAVASAGFTTYQSKPVDSALLKKNLERLLEKRPNDGQ
jgi:CheY-like chemotaxis protein